MANILEKITQYKKDEVLALKSRITVDSLRRKAMASPRPRGFHAALDKAAQFGPALIAEIKKASPSKGIIRADFMPEKLAQAYDEGGAACLSVLTDMPSFMGSIDILRQVRGVTDLPILRKDFMLDPIQVYESRLIGADAILVIMAMIDDKIAKNLIKAANAMQLDILIETHDEEELWRALRLGAKLIGINNRDLRTFNTSLSTFERLARLAPPGITLVAESGIFTSDDILRLTTSGAKACLVGESLMRADDVCLATQQLLGTKPASR